MKVQLNDFAEQWRAIRPEALEAVDRVGASGWLVLGDEVRAFEAALAASCGLAHAVGCGNGLDAIEIALRAAGLRPGDRVVTTPLSAFATTLAILRAGGVPVFVDVDRLGLLDLDRVAAEVERDASIRAVVPVHLYGHPLDGDRLRALASRPGLAVVEDCAQAVGASWRGVPVGAAGRAAATSFYPTKNLGALGDGGAVLTDDAELAARAGSLRDYGQSAKYVHDRLGLNSRLDEVQAAVLRSALLPRLPGFTARRRALAERYLAEIRNPALALPVPPPGAEPVWHLFVVRVEGDRASFCRHLDEAEVGWAIHYPRLIPDQPAMAGAAHEVRGALATARRLAAAVVSLPLHPWLADGDAARVIAACNAWTP